MKLYFLTLVGVMLLQACAAPVNRHTAQSYYQAGDTAMRRGHLEQAREMFSRALINAKLGDLGTEAEAQIFAKLGRVYGNMCRYDEAEKAFKDSLAAFEKAFGDTSAKYFPIRLEIAQFSYDIGRYDKAIHYFEQALPYGGDDYETADPASFAAVMKDYSNALTHEGKFDRATQIQNKIIALENKIGKAKIAQAIEAYTRYPKKCK